MPPVHSPCRAVVSSSIALVSNHRRASCIEYVSHLNNSRASIREDSSTARITHLSNLGTCRKHFYASSQVVHIQVTLAVFAHIQVEALRTYNNTLRRGRLGVVHTVYNNVAQHRIAIRVNAFLAVTELKTLHEAYYSLRHIVMYARKCLVVHILRRDNGLFRINGCVGVGYSLQLARLPLKCDIPSRHDGDSLGKQLTELLCGFHREVFEECHYAIHRTILEPFALVRSGTDCFVGRKISCMDSMAKEPVARHRTIVARRREYALQEDIVVVFRAYLLLFFILAVDVEQFGWENDHSRGRNGVARYGHIYIFLGVGVEHCRRGLQRPSAVVVPCVVTDDVLDINEYLRSTYA